MIYRLPLNEREAVKELRHQFDLRQRRRALQRRLLDVALLLAAAAAWFLFT